MFPVGIIQATNTILGAVMFPLGHVLFFGGILFLAVCAAIEAAHVLRQRLRK
jgi:hypothetical protein